MTVSIEPQQRFTLSVVGGVKQLHRRHLPTRARLASNRKRALTSSQKEIIITPSRRLNILRRSYARRGVPTTVTPPRRVDTKLEVARPSTEHGGITSVSLAGAKRSYLPLDVPSDVEYDSDSSGSCLSVASSCMMNDYQYQRYLKAARCRVRSVQFATLCSAVEIPHHCEYTARQKIAMWNGSKKIRMMAKRNSAEFQFDGWNIETASEEDKFVVVNGKSVHPVYAAQPSEETSITTSS